MKFDETIKARARREGSPVPPDYDSKVKTLLDTLPEQAGLPRRRRLPVSRVAVVAVAAVFVVGAGAATVGPSVLSMTQGAIQYFQNRDSAYSSQKAILEQYNAAVGVSQTVDGQTLTIDNIAIDDSYMTVFYTLTSETPIQKVGSETDPEPWRAGWTAPIFWATVNGKEMDTSGAIDSEASFVNDCTLTGIHRLVLRDQLPDTFDLLLYTGGTSREVDAKYRFNLSIDKSAVAVKSLTVTPKTKAHIHFDEKVYPDQGAESVHEARDYTIRIDRVSISPLGSSITISEGVGLLDDDRGPFCSFALRDDKGNYLPVLSSSGLISGGLPGTRFSNVFEFISDDIDMKSLTLVPVESPGHAHQISGDINALPLTDDTKTGLILESLDIGAEKVIARFSEKLPSSSTCCQFQLLDGNGTIPDFLDGGYMDTHCDRETGQWVSTIYFEQPLTEEQLAQIKQVEFFQPDEITLLEEQAATIPLQS